MKTLYEIQNAYNNGAYSVANFYPHYLKDDYIFDENLTIKENKALIEKHNKAQKEKYNESLRQQNLAYERLKADLVSWLTSEYHFSFTQAEKLYSKVWDKEHHSTLVLFDKIEEEADFIQEFIASKEN